MSDNNNCNIFEFEQELYAANDACFFRKIDHKSLESGERYDSNKLFGLNGWTSHPLTGLWTVVILSLYDFAAYRTVYAEKRSCNIYFLM